MSITPEQRLSEIYTLAAQITQHAKHLVLDDLINVPQQAVDLYRRLCEHEGFDLSPLRGRDLACWCPLGQPCHADVLLDLANREER